MDRNVIVKRRTSPVVLNQKGPLERDMDIPDPNIVIGEKTKVKRVWWNPLTYFRGGSKGSTSSGSDNTGIMDQG